MILRWFKSVTFSQRDLLLIVVVGLIGAGFFSLVWEPTTDEISILKKSIDSVQQEIDLQSRRGGEFSDDNGSRKDMETSGPSQEALVISMVQPLQFRQDVIKVLNGYGLQLSLWNPGREPYSETNRSRLPIQGRVEGGYHKIAQGLAAMLQLPWVLEINHLRVSLLQNVAGEKSSLVADFQLVGLSVPPSVEFPSAFKN